MRPILPLLSTALLAACITGPAWPDSRDANLIEQVEEKADLSNSLSDQIWEWAEVGYQEEKSSGLLQQTLKVEGFDVEAGVAGIPTARAVQSQTAAERAASLAASEVQRSALKSDQ